MPGPNHFVTTAEVHSNTGYCNKRRGRSPARYDLYADELDLAANNGPLSLKDSNNGETAMLQAPVTQPTPAKENGPTSGSGEGQGHGDAVTNGDIDINTLVNIKNLEENELLKRVEAISNALKGFEDYDTGEGLRLLKAFGDMYFSYRKSRVKIGDQAAKCGMAEIGMKVLKKHNQKGVFKNDDIWFPTYYTLNFMWNFTDASQDLAKEIAKHDGVRFFTANCSHEPYIENLQNKNVYYLVKSSMSIINNISRCSDVIHYFKENNTQEVMMSYLKVGNDNQEMLKILAMLTLAHTVEEEDNEKLIDDTGAIQCIIRYIKLAVENSKRRHRGFTPHELMVGLTKLGVNDINKKKIVDHGALPVFMKLLESDQTEEQAVAAKAIWTLSFEKDVCKTLVEYEGLLPALEKLSKSQDADVRKQSSGALFVLHGENDVSKRPKSAIKNRGHVFLSYSWSEKEIVLKLRDHLKAEGFEVWIDIERMGGSTLSAMADAVEGAAVVLICMSEKYKQSPNCRLEAEYTFQLRKDYVPLMVQRKYRPDGWLGAILGAKLFFDFSGKYPFEKPWTGLIKELTVLGKLTNTGGQAKDAVDGMITAHAAHTSGAAPSHSSALTSSQALLKMTQDDVRNWLCDIKLDGCVPSLAQFDGAMLEQLLKMRDEAPEFYYRCLETKLNFNLVEILTFNKELQKL